MSSARVDAAQIGRVRDCRSEAGSVFFFACFGRFLNL